MADEIDPSLRQLVDEVCRRGLRTPALMVFDLWSPLGFFGEQLLTGFGPLLPLQPWREGARQALEILRDDHKRERLRQLFQEHDS